MGIYKDIEFPVSPQRPYVVLNMVSTADGKAVPPAPTYSLFASPNDWEAMVDLRVVADAVMNGATTAMQVKPSQFRSPRFLERRDARGKTRPPDYAIVSSGRGLDASARVFSDPGTLRPLVYLPASALPGLDPSLESRASIIPIGEDQLEPEQVLKDLHQRHHVRLLLVEGGPRLNTTLLRHRLVDELFLTIAPKIFGGSAPLTIVEGEPLVPESVQLGVVTAQVLNGEVFLRYRVRYADRPAQARKG